MYIFRYWRHLCPHLIPTVKHVHFFLCLFSQICISTCLPLDVEVNMHPASLTHGNLKGWSKLTLHASQACNSFSNVILHITSCALLWATHLVFVIPKLSASFSSSLSEWEVCGALSDPGGWGSALTHLARACTHTSARTHTSIQPSLQR